MLGLFLQPNACELIERSNSSSLVKKHAIEVIEDGFTIIPGAVSKTTCDDLISQFRLFEKRNEAIFSKERDENGHYPRIVNFHFGMPKLIELFTQNTILLAVQDLLFGTPTSLYTSLFYETGSQQSIHRDTPLFSTRPPLLYFGNTVYLESADDSNGCLEVIRGAHKLPEVDIQDMASRRYGDLSNIPDFDPEAWGEYQSKVCQQSASAGLSVEQLHVNAGDSLIWHPQLPHGGSQIADLSRTRFSLVMHTVPVGTPVYQGAAFFNAHSNLSEKAAWGYLELSGRKIIDFSKSGVVFSTRSLYPVEAFEQIEPEQLVVDTD